MSKSNIQCIVIDPQNSFCDPKGELYVAGADKDMERLAKMILKHGDKIDDVRISLDSHSLVHIAHPICWVDQNGKNPPPFTMISEDDITGTNPKWRAYNPAWQKRQVDYVKALKAGGRYVLVIWPPHCQIGSWGHAVYPVLFDAITDWQTKYFATIDFVTKGSNLFTEHYSIVKADVPDSSDPSTNINTSFIQRLETATDILIAGEALSHCVANSCRDIINEFGVEHAKKFVILEDATSSVTGFEKMGEDFIAEMKGLGVRFSTTTTFFK